MVLKVSIAFVHAHITRTSNIITTWRTRTRENRRGYSPLSFEISFLHTMYLCKFHSSSQWLDIKYAVTISEHNMFVLCILFHSVVLCLIFSTIANMCFGRCVYYILNTFASPFISYSTRFCTLLSYSSFVKSLVSLR